MRSAEADKGTYLDTTIASPGDSSTLIRVDVSPGVDSQNPEAAAAPVVAQLRREAGYRLLDYSLFTFEGYTALHWEFLVSEGGVLMHKEEVVFTSASGDDFGVLVQAPASEYSALASFFTQVFDSLSVN